MEAADVGTGLLALEEHITAYQDEVRKEARRTQEAADAARLRAQEAFLEEVGQVLGDLWPALLLAVTPVPTIGGDVALEVAYRGQTFLIRRRKGVFATYDLVRRNAPALSITDIPPHSLRCSILQMLARIREIEEEIRGAGH